MSLLRLCIYRYIYFFPPQQHARQSVVVQLLPRVVRRMAEETGYSWDHWPLSRSAAIKGCRHQGHPASRVQVQQCVPFSPLAYIYVRLALALAYVRYIRISARVTRDFARSIRDLGIEVERADITTSEPLDRRGREDCARARGRPRLLEFAP